MMKATYLLAILLMTSAVLKAQQPPPPADSKTDSNDPVEAAIRAFNNRDRSKPNEVTVVLEPGNFSKSDKTSSENRDAHQDKSGSHKAKSGNTVAKAVLITGKAPQDTHSIDISDIPIEQDAADKQLLENQKPTAPKGLQIHVAHIHTGKGDLDTSKVKLRAPFPAKPLSSPPKGWKLKTDDNAPTFKRQVELMPGKKITLTIRPQLLVPETDGSSTFAVEEPGFRASLGYRQSDTVAAVLSKSLNELNEDSKRLGKIIDQLQQLMVSLPKATIQPEKAVKATVKHHKP